MKLAIALIAALAVPTASMATVGDAFDSHGRTVEQCYTAKNNARLCVQQLNEFPNIRTVSVIHEGETYPSTMFVNCENGYWEYFGTLDKEKANKIGTAVCE